METTKMHINYSEKDFLELAEIGKQLSDIISEKTISIQDFPIHVDLGKFLKWYNEQKVFHIYKNGKDVSIHFCTLGSGTQFYSWYPAMMYNFRKSKEEIETMIKDGWFVLDNIHSIVDLISAEVKTQFEEKHKVESSTEAK